MFPNTMRLTLSTCALSAFLVGSAFGQQNVTFADLKGAVIHTLVRYENVGSGNGRPFRNVSESNQTIRIISDQAATFTTVFKNDARQTSPTRSGSFTLGKTLETQGGDHHWTFQDGELIHFRTFKAGGWRSTITFTRNGDKGFGCKVRSVFLSESGVAGWNWTSPITGENIRMHSSRAIYSSCQVTMN
jgi:hypothetical protein